MSLLGTACIGLPSTLSFRYYGRNCTASCRIAISNRNGAKLHSFDVCEKLESDAAEDEKVGFDPFDSPRFVIIVAQMAISPSFRYEAG
jgi:hypothetical protein